MDKMILIKGIKCCRDCLYLHTPAVYYEHDICQHPKCDLRATQRWVLYNIDKLPDWCPLEDDFSEDMERQNFLMWYKLATTEDIEMARKHNEKELDRLIDKYKGEIPKRLEVILDGEASPDLKI